jgi:hypothetical protein
MASRMMLMARSERDDARVTVFRPASGQAPFTRRQVDRCAHAGNFADALRGHEAKPDDPLALNGFRGAFGRTFHWSWISPSLRT